MAGDWMKIELELPEKPEVHAIANILNIDPDCVVGKLIKVWGWFNKHTENGNAYGVTYSLLDRITNVSGFGEAMSYVGWIEQQDKNLVMPKFDRHTSQSAKSRALGAQRTLKSRNKSNGECNGVSVTETSRNRQQEKRREENKYIPPISDDLFRDYQELRKAKGVGKLTENAFAGIVKQAEIAGITPEEAVRICVENGWAGFKAAWISESQGKKAQLVL